MAIISHFKSETKTKAKMEAWFPQKTFEVMPICKRRISAATGLDWHEVNRRVSELLNPKDGGKPLIKIADRKGRSPKGKPSTRFWLNE